MDVRNENQKKKTYETSDQNIHWEKVSENQGLDLKRLGD